MKQNSSSVEEFTKTDSYEGLVRVLEDISEVPLIDLTSYLPETRSLFERYQNELKRNPKNIKCLFSYAYAIERLTSEQETALKIYAEIAKKEFTPLLHHLIGTILMHKGLFKQSYLLFDRGLVMESPDSNGNNIHIIFHRDLSDLGYIIHSETDRPLESFGFPVSNIGFKFNPEKGFYLPDFDFNELNRDYEDFGEEVGKERVLLRIHSRLAETKKIRGDLHKSNNCPYLKYVSRG